MQQTSTKGVQDKTSLSGEGDPLGIVPTLVWKTPSSSSSSSCFFTLLRIFQYNSNGGIFTGEWVTTSLLKSL